MNTINCRGVTLFDEEEQIDECDADISPSTKEKVAVAKAYFAEYYFDLLDYLGTVKERHEHETASEPHELRTRRFTSMSVPPLFQFGKAAPISPVSTVRRKDRKRPSHASTLLLFEDTSASGPSSPANTGSSSSSSSSPFKEILTKPAQDAARRRAFTATFQQNDKVLLEETKKKLAEKEHMTDVAAQLGKSLLVKVDEYEQQVEVLAKKVEEDERALQRLADFQSEAAVWKEKHAILLEKVLILESQNVRLEEQLAELHSKHKEEREKVKPLLMRNRSLRSNFSDLEMLKDEVALAQAAENGYKRQLELSAKKNQELEKEVERLKTINEAVITNGHTAPKVKRAPVQNYEKEDLLQFEIGVSYKEVISLLERMLNKLAQVEKDCVDAKYSHSILANSGKWIEHMLAESRPLMFKSLTSKLLECGILSLSQKDLVDCEQQSILQISALLLTCLTALQLAIDSTTIHQESVVEWKRKSTLTEKELSEMKPQVRILEADIVSLQAQLAKIKQENTSMIEKERRRRASMVDSAVNTEPIRKEHQATNTDEVQNIHVSVTTEEKGVNTETNTEVPLTTPQNEVVLHESQEIEKLKEELGVLKEELKQANNPPSQRLKVTPWEKDYQSDIQGPLIRYINTCLQGYPYLSHVLPANPDLHVNRATYDGVLLCTLVNYAHPGILDERVVNFIPDSDLEAKQNFVLTINTAMAMGCVVPTTNPDLLLANPHFMLDMLYQLVKCEVFRKINVEHHPELVRLRKDNETPSKFRCTGPNELLQRWAELHHKSLSASLPSITSNALSDSDYHAIFESISTSRLETNKKDWIEEYASQVGVQRPALYARDNLPLQSLFLAQLLHASPSLEPLSDGEMVEVEGKHDIDPEGTREERAFVTWINGLGIPVFVSNLQHDMGDGLVLLHTLDKIERGCIHWKEVNMQPNNAYKKAENCNLGINTCISKLNFSLVGIGGKDILDGNRKLILAVMWQACKHHLLAALRTCGGGVEVTESDVLSYINKRIPQPISSFKDPSLKTGLPLLDLLLHIAPDVLKQENIRRKSPLSPEDCLLNAKYAIGVARKIFVLPPVQHHPSSNSVPPSSSSSSSSSSPSPSPLPSVHSTSGSHSHARPSSRSPRHLASSLSSSASSSTHKQAVDIPLCLPILPDDIVEAKPKMLFIFVAMMMLVDKAHSKS